MFRLLYGFSLRLYFLLIRLAAPFKNKARAWLSGRRDIPGKVREHFSGEESVIWFHAASLGEFEQGRPLIEAIRRKCPDRKILLTFFSPSGYEVRKDYPLVDMVCYLPLDTMRRMRQFVELVNPEVLFIIKYDFWFNLFSVLRERGISIYLVSGIFRPGQHFFRWWGRWFLKNLNAITWFFVQDEASEGLLRRAGYSNVTVSGDTRFDRVVRIAEENEPVALPEGFTDGSPVIVAGSTWPPDETLIAALADKAEGVRWIIAPHNVDDAHVASLMRKLPTGSAIRLSETSAQTGTENILVVDSIGLLNRLYRYATIAYVGGGFGRGIHNLLEAAVYNCPVIFGPNFSIFREAHDLIRLGGGYSIRDEKELTEIVVTLLTDENRRRKASEAAGGYVAAGTGATEIILGKTGYH